MKLVFNKYIIIILSFYAFWILGLPFIFTELLPKVCENISLNSDFTIEMDKPQLYLTPLPKASFKAKNIKVKSKKTEDFTSIENFETSIRLLPLLSGKVHINKIQASEIKINSVLKKELELDKNFFKNLNKTKIKLNELNVEEFAVNIHQPGLSEPVIYTARNIYFKKNARALNFNLSSELNIKGSISQANVNLYLPRNNDVDRSVVDVTFDNFDIAPLGDYLRQYLPNGLSDIRGIINVRIDKNLQAVLDNCAVIMKDSAKSIILPDTLNINSKFNLTSKVINFEYVDVKSENIKASLSGAISNYLDKSITMVDFNVILDKSRVEDIVNLLR